jgi:hypothetical protein
LPKPAAFIVHPEDEDSRFLQNSVIYLSNYTALRLRRPYSIFTAVKTSDLFRYTFYLFLTENRTGLKYIKHGLNHIAPLSRVHLEK